MRRACPSSSWPWAVGRRPRAWRSNSVAPTSSSSSLSHFDSPGWVVWARRAVSLRLPVSAKLTSRWRWRRRRRRLQSIIQSCLCWYGGIATYHYSHMACERIIAPWTRTTVSPPVSRLLPRRAAWPVARSSICHR
nr:hypothetical protein [Pseudomonas sp. C5pp]